MKASQQSSPEAASPPSLDFDLEDWRISAATVSAATDT